MRFGFCTTLDNASALKAAGAAFVEEHVQNLLQAQVADDDWKGLARAKVCPLPIPAANCLIPGDLKITGPSVDFQKLRAYIATVLKRAQSIGIKILVFGSGVARNVPEGFDRNHARNQILDFLKMVSPLAANHEITFVAEPLNKGECNIINTVAEAMTYVNEVNHPNFQCLVDSYHFWKDGDSLEDLHAAMKWIRHVHVADVQGRVFPGESGKSDYRAFFNVLKKSNYQGVISVEAPDATDYKNAPARVINFLNQQWQAA